VRLKNPWNFRLVPAALLVALPAAVAQACVVATTEPTRVDPFANPPLSAVFTGLKPTYVVFSFGNDRVRFQPDQAGQWQKSAEDCATLMQAMSGFDEKDSTVF